MWQNYFMTANEVPIRVMTGHYNITLVVMSYFIASFGAFVALMLSHNMGQTQKKINRQLLHIAGAFSLGSGIWSMHFVGMLAYEMTMPVVYDLNLSLASMIVAVLVAYAVLYVSRLTQLKFKGVILAAILLGLAVSLMHYMGMQAMLMAADLRYWPSVFVISVAIAIVAAGAALSIVFYLGQRVNNFKTIMLRGLAAGIIGVAVCAMHYTGMHAAVFTPNSEICAVSIQDAAQQRENLVLIVQLITGLIFALSLGLALYKKEQDSIYKGRLVDTFPAQLLYGCLFITVVTLFWVGSRLHILTEILAKHLYEDDFLLTVNSVTENLKGQLTFMQAMPVILIGVLALLAVIWFYALRSLYRWRCELLRAKDLADKANKAKSDFLANMSHELRTPMNSVLGMTDLVLADGELKTEHRDTLIIAKRAGYSLLDIVNDILDLSKIEAHGLVLEEVPFEINFSVRQVIETLMPIASQKGLLLECYFNNNDQKPIVVIGDALRLSRVLTNLVSNAIKYTDQGKVMVHLSTQGVSDNFIELHCDVIDTGIGIAEHKLDLVFEKFAQADTSTTRRFGGTGLGLTITKQLVEMMGGQINVKSKIGKGSVFSFTIPYALATDQEIIALESSLVTQGYQHMRKIAALSPNDIELLVAEDHPLNQIFVKKLLANFGISNVTIVENGELLLEAYQTGLYDLILMDCHMPKMNGYDATKAIRALELSTDKHIPIIAMTANAMIGDRDECLAAGMDDYISKPIDAQIFKNMLSQWIDFLPIAGAASSNAIDTPANLSLLEPYTGGDIELLKEFIHIFIEQTEKQLEILANSCVDGPCEAWVEAAHAIKGGAANIGAEVLRLQAERSQKMADTSAEHRVQKLERLQQSYKQVKAYLADQGYL